MDFASDDTLDAELAGMNHSYPSSIPPGLRARFDDLQFLGAGGMGSVYRAKDRQLGRDVAIKFLHQADPETNRMLLREARAQARLDHENACKVYEVGVDGERPYIVMQYIAGESLERMANRMKLGEKVRVIMQVALALHEAHRWGIVHRDVKPANIMIERSEDGTYKPYIMDFGIAREMGPSSQTTSSFAGTPAYMAPEQATGDVAALDRRTDVYSLGATLYDLLAGRAPFVGSNPMAVLRQLLMDDPPSLRKTRGRIPVDIDAIVMKCLEKEPERRYDSARAFVEDLQRFLDGTPVLARNASLAYVLYKALRKHKMLVMLAVVVVAVFTTFGVLWIGERRTKAEQAAISREIGENVKEMELFLSRAYGLPLHDIERERRIVRQQLRDIETRMVALGKTGEGPGHYALGRGFLALQEHEEALVHLRRADAAGYAPPELRYAMGLVLVELYSKALDETKRIQNDQVKKEKIAAIDAEYKEPALAHLRAALGARLSSPAYVEGLIAFHEGQYDVALEKARTAFAQSPWLHEAKKLEGDALFAKGKRFGRDAAFDDEKMMAAFEPAALAYQEAADIARSDPAVHEAECELWTRVVIASDAKPERFHTSFDKATSACQRAVTADPQRFSAHLKMAFAHTVFAWQASRAPEREEPTKNIEAAIQRVEDVARLQPQDPMAQYLVGSVYRTEIVRRLIQGLDARIPMDRAIAAHEEAIRLDPGFLWPYNEVCASYGEQARMLIWRGIDPSPSVQRAIERCDQAISRDPNFTLPIISKAFAHARMAQYLVENGKSPEASVTNALAIVATVKEQNKLDATNLTVWSLLHRASYQCDAGQDPRSALTQIEVLLRELEQLAPSSNGEIEGLAAKIRALYLLRTGGDPLSAVDAARGFFRKLVASSPQDVDYRVEWARTEIIALRYAFAKGDVRGELFETGFATLSPLLDKPRADPRIYQALAELHELRASFLQSRKQDASMDLTNGLVRANQALALNPHMATALATKGALELLAARADARDVAVLKPAAARAKEALEAAMLENPLLMRDRGSLLKEAQGLLDSR